MPQKTKKEYKNKEGTQTWGELNEHRVFVKHVKHNVHFMKEFQGYGIQSSVIDDLKKQKCKKVVLIETDEEKLWEVSFKKFVAKSFEREFLCYGAQMFLTKKYWDIYDKNNKLIS